MCSSLPKAFSDRWSLGWGGVGWRVIQENKVALNAQRGTHHPQPFVLGSMCEWQGLGNAECQGRDVGLILRVGNRKNQQ